MIFLFYGDDPTMSRQALSKVRSGYSPPEVFPLDETTSIDEFQNLLAVAPLFAPEKLLVLEVTSEKSPIINDEAFFTLLGDKPLSSHVAVWVGGNLNSRGRIIKQFQELKANLQAFFALPERKVFPFLSALLRKQRLRALRELLALRREGHNEHYLLTMVAWQLRQLIMFIDGDSKPAPFQRSDLEAAKQLFALTELSRLYRQAYLADLESKTGRADLALNLFWLVERITR